MTVEHSTASRRLFGYTRVSSLEFVFDPVRSKCDLTLRLDNPSSGKTLALILSDVSGLRLKEFGGRVPRLRFPNPTQT